MTGLWARVSGFRPLATGAVLLACALIVPPAAAEPAGQVQTSVVGALDVIEGGAPECDSAVPIVSLSAGRVCGIVRSTVRGQRSHAYLGIPFAEPPVGPLRWKPPVRLASLGSGVYSGTTYKSICVAPGPGEFGYIGSEDCLYLNLYAPPVSDRNSPLPVMVYIHGGGFLASQSNLELDGTALANEGVIVVSLSYRLGSLGFLRASGAGFRYSGNQGVQDQQLALQWVQQNIPAFGGDPAQVTVFGESAGAMSVATHLFSAPSSNGLFRAAIMESNIAGLHYDDRSQAESIGADFVHLLCRSYSNDVRGCEARPESLLASLTTEQIAQAEVLTLPPGGMPGLITQSLTNGLRSLWGPTIGVYPMVNRQPVLGFAPGVTPKPFLFGVNETEGAFFLPSPSTMTAGEYRSILAKAFGAEQSQRILDFRENGRRLYSPTNYRPLPGGGLTPASQALARLQTDFVVAAANILTAQNALSRTRTADVPIFGYHFLKRSSFDFTGLPRCAPASGNVCHTNEIPYVWSDFVEKDEFGLTVPVRNVTPEELALGERMTRDWAAFAKDPIAGLGATALSDGNDRHFITYSSASPTAPGRLLPKSRADLWMPIIQASY
jgi:carboxylesterase type B